MNYISEIILAIIGLVTIIFGVIKAYINMKNKEGKNKVQLNKNTVKNENVQITNSKVIISGETNINDNQPRGDSSNVNLNDENMENVIRLKEKYTSLFAEDNLLKSEQIIITKQKGSVVIGKVILIEEGYNDKSIHRYLLKGTFSNKVLTAEYYSENGEADERGAINLKLVDKDILSGFCSFSKLSGGDEIRVSPYVWVAGENMDLLNGTFTFCTKCHEGKKVCCCANKKVDMPILFNFELNSIRNDKYTSRKEKNIFSKNLSKPFQNCPVRQMRIEKIHKKESDEEVIKCYFYNIDSHTCNIYENRPIDCRIFPFDIKLSQTSNEYVIGYYKEICEITMPDFHIMKKNAHILRPYFFILYPYLHLITLDEVSKNLNDEDFQVIAKFNEFVF